jgi:hypothetical protein
MDYLALDVAVSAIIRTIISAEKPKAKAKPSPRMPRKPRPSPVVPSNDPPEYNDTLQDAEDAYEAAMPPQPRLDFVPETDAYYPAPPSPLPADKLQQAREALVAHELTDQELESGILNSTLRPEDIRDASTVAKAQRLRQRLAYPEDRSIGNALPRSAEDAEYDL